MTGFNEPDPFRWRVPLYAAALMFGYIFLVELVAGNDNAFLGGIGIALLVCFVCFCVVLIPLLNRKYLLALSVACVIPATLLGAALGLYCMDFTRTDVRWLFVANRYKTLVRNQSDPQDGTLRNVEWDGWGFAGEDTTEYLVFDPSDSLPRQASGPGRYKGIPCEVPKVRRMEPHWYVVLFYTETAWNYCGP